MVLINSSSRKLDLTFTKLSPVQSDWLFASLENNNSLRLTTASFKAANLQHVRPDTLAAVIVRLEKVNLSFTELTREQLTALFERINKRNNVSLKDIELFSVDLSPVSEKLLGKAVSRLENANLSNTELTQEQIQEILKSILDTKSPIKLLNLDFSEVFSISDQLFAKSLSLVCSVSLACSGKSQEILFVKSVKLIQVDQNEIFSQLFPQ